MRSILSFLVLFSLMISTTVAGHGQITRRPEPGKPAIHTSKTSIDEASTLKGKAPAERAGRKFDKAPATTRFAKVESFTEGKGVYIRWQMEVERGNAGFRVYRLSKMGQTPVSEPIPGSIFSYGDQPLYGGEYFFYDPKGSLGSVYTVEALSVEGSIETAALSPTYVVDIDGVDGGTAMKVEAHTFKPGANMVSNDVVVSAELQTEIQSGLIEPAPTKHLEVIAQPGVRIESKADGLIRVTRDQLAAGGFDVNSDPGNWQIYLQGVELPMIIGPNADYIEFFGKKLDSIESDIRTYFLITGNSAGRRIASQTVRRPITSVVSRKYNQSFVRQDKKNYFNQVLNGSADNWWGDIAIQNSNNNPTNLNFVLSGIDRTPGTRRLTISFQGFSITPHVVGLVLNGQSIGTVNATGRFPFSKSFDVPVELFIDGNNTLAMRPTGGTLPTQPDIVILNKVTIDLPRDYVAVNNKLEFYTDNYKNAKVSGFTTPNIRVFDVTYENTPRLLTNLEMVETNGTWGPVMPANRERLIYAVADGVYGTAISVTPNNPEMLQDPSLTGQMVLIAHPSLLAEAQTWANYRSNQGVVTKVVNVTDIFDEFSYGVSSSFAIEDFLFYAKNNWQIPPSYVMLFGDAHYDTRNFFGGGYWNMVPSRLVDTLYTETGSDEALSDFNNDGLAEIPIGRVASRTPAGVTALYNKTVAWEASLTSNALDRGVLFAFDWPDGYNFEAMSDRVMSNLPAGVPKTRVAHSTFNPDTNTWVANPNAQADIIGGLNNTDGGTTEAPGANAGKFVINYAGHGSSVAWRSSGFFSSDQAPQLTNANYPTIMVALTCLNAYFMSNAPTFAETMTQASNGGAVAVWASTGLTTPDVQEIMGNRFYTKLGQGTIQRMGDLVADAKAQVPAGADVRLSWALLGDPMLKVR